MSLYQHTSQNTISIWKTHHFFDFIQNKLYTITSSLLP